MKKLLFLMATATALAAVCSCGGSSPSQAIAVSLDELNDYYTVKSVKFETDAKKKGIEHLNDVKGTLTLKLKRNKTEMKLKASDVDYASVGGDISSTSTYVFIADCDAVVRNMMKMEPDATETFVINISGCDPYNQFSSEEKNQKDRQSHFDALTKDGCLDQICFDIEFKQEYAEMIDSLKDIFDDEDDD